MGTVTIYTCDRCGEQIKGGIRDAERITFGFKEIGSILDYKQRWLICVPCKSDFLEFMENK